MIEIFDQDGDVKDYIPVSERLGAFLEQYGPEQGYRIETGVKDYLGLHPDITRIYRAAMESSKSVGGHLPVIDEALFCFQARLLDPHNYVVAQASALRRIDTSLDLVIQGRLWESAETAALQRLMARLGFGSDTLLSDELGDMAARGVNYKAPNAEASVEQSADESDSEPGSASEVSSDDEAGTDADTQDRPDEEDDGAGKAEPKIEAKTAKAKRPKAKTPTAAKATPAEGEVSDALLRQIRSLAAARGIEPPEVSTKAEAKEALKSLRASPAPANA